MPVTNLVKDLDALTLTVEIDLDATVERAWQLLADPRQLERWWGPPGWPATVTEHDLSVGGVVRYAMTGPDDESSQGYWQVVEAEAPVRLEVLDGFANEDGTPNDDMPSMRMVFTITERDGGARMTSVTSFPTHEAMLELVAMGMEEGIRAAAGQIDAVLASATA